VPDEKLVQLDEFIKSPEGKILAENLATTFIFKDAIDVTEVDVFVKGNADDKFMQECETGWTDCFEHLNELIAKETSARFKGKAGEFRPNI
jgi:hypothetical protein